MFGEFPFYGAYLVSLIYKLDQIYAAGLEKTRNL